MVALLRFDSGAPEVLLMKRVTNPKDRWSGHVSFPGGRHELDDADLLQTAIRETREEVGLALNDCARLIGRLDDVRAIARGRALPMAITPFVFFQTRADPIVLGDEAESFLWLPLDKVVSGRLSGKVPYKLGLVSMDLPCWRFEGYVVWGLTYRMISNLLQVIQG